MSNLSRRTVLGAVAFVGLAKAVPKPKRPKLGVVVWLEPNGQPEDVIARVRTLGFTTCQLAVRKPDLSLAATLKSAIARNAIEVTAVLSLGPGRALWDLSEGPLTVGLVPRENRAARIAALQSASDLAAQLRISAVHTHCGFVPESAHEPAYTETVAAVQQIARHCQKNGQILLCETGQETPITLVRLIRDSGQTNIFVNLDMANLILYGKGNPVDAMGVLGKYVRGVHAKDGRFPKNPDTLGEEVPIGEGNVDFPEVFRLLHNIGYSDAVTIERETHGAEQERDIARAKQYLEQILDKSYGVG